MKIDSTNAASVMNATDDTNKELLDNVQVNISNGDGHYINTNNALLQRMDSGGLIDVATAAGLYLSGGSGVLPPPDQYPPEEILSAQDLTEEDRKLAAALVAVQLVQQQKQQQLLLHDSAISSAANNAEVANNSLSNITNIVHNDKITLHENLADTQSLILQHGTKGVDSVVSNFGCSLDNSRISTVKLNNNLSSSNVSNVANHNSRKGAGGSYKSRTVRKTTNKNNVSPGSSRSKYILSSTSPVSTVLKQEDTFDLTIKSEDVDLSDFSDDLDSDFDDIIETHSARKSLPHKKRISRKLKTSPTKGSSNSKTNQNSYPKCVKCVKCGDQIRSQTSHNDHKDKSHKENGMLVDSSGMQLRNNLVTFACQLCPQMFNSQLNFFEHLKRHYEPVVEINEDRSQQIFSSDNSSKQTDSQKSATVLESFRVTSFKCNECGKMFRRQKFFEAHIRDAHPKVNKLEMEEFSEPEDLMEGIRVVVDDENGQTVLSNGHDQQAQHATIDHIVSLRNSNPHQILASSNIIVNDSKVWYREDDELHATEADLQELEAQQLKEQQIQLQNSLTSYVCSMCGAIFDQRVYLTQHMNECYLVLKQEAELLNSSPPDDDKLNFPLDGVKDLNKGNKRKKKGHLMCTVCGRIFNHRNSLVYHLRSHSGERPHQCEQCGKSFFATSALKVHMRLHSGDKPYKCEYCGRHFRQWGDLKYHCISIHSNQRQYQCEYCGKDFARKYSLIVHRRIHTGEKNYQCEYCKKTFRASSYLQNHRKIHTGEKPHPCEICGKPFRVRSDMKRHMNTHNRDRFNKGSSTDIKTNLSSDSDHAESNAETTPSVTSTSLPIKEKEIHIPIIPKTETSIKIDTQEVLQTPKEEDISGTLYTVPADPLTIREGNNTVYVWPVYMS